MTKQKLNLLSFILLILISSSCHDIDFDSEKWKNWNESEHDWSIRWDMTDDLINNYHLKGKDTTEIFHLLGKVDLNCLNDTCLISYTLGPCRSGIDYGVLELTFAKGKVSEISKRCN